MFGANLGVTWGIWGRLWVIWDSFGVTLRSLVAYEGNFGATWGHLGLTLAFEGDFGDTLASLWAQFLHMMVTLGSLWGHLGAILGPLWVHGVDFTSFWDQHGMILKPFRVYEGPFSKNNHFPHRI